MARSDVPPEGGGLSLEGACVLLIEDDPASAKLEALLLRAARCHVQVARDATAGALLLLAGLRPAVILLDLQLPDMDGLDLARFLNARRATPRIPIVAVTSAGPSHRATDARAAGCDGFIRKPIDAETFATQVASYLRTGSLT